jgi:cysteine desulfurase/selenocysteine lyase
MKVLGIPGTVRASFAFYNTEEEVDRLATSLVKVRAMTSR